MSQATVVTMGTFDGLHRGHQAVLAELTRRARAGKLASVLVTFDPHPLAVVNPAAAPKLLSLPEEKEVAVRAAALERFVLMPFTPAVAQLDAEAFVRRLRDEYAMRELVMGYDHGFGRGRAGDVELVQRLAGEQGFGIAVVDAVRDDGTVFGGLSCGARGATGRSAFRRSTSRRPIRESCCRPTACMRCR